MMKEKAMSQPTDQPAASTSNTDLALSDSAVADYLRDHPDFLIRNPDVLDALAPPTRARGEISPEMRKKLLGESVGLGGLPEKPMPSNIFLNIILGVFAIVVVAYVGGIRP